MCKAALIGACTATNQPIRRTCIAAAREHFTHQSPQSPQAQQEARGARDRCTHGAQKHKRHRPPKKHPGVLIASKHRRRIWRFLPLGPPGLSYLPCFESPRASPRPRFRFWGIRTAPPGRKAKITDAEGDGEKKEDPRTAPRLTLRAQIRLQYRHQNAQPRAYVRPPPTNITIWVERPYPGPTHPHRVGVTTAPRRATARPPLQLPVQRQDPQQQLALTASAPRGQVCIH